MWLYSDLLQALKGKHLSALGRQERGLKFLLPQYPAAGYSIITVTIKNRTTKFKAAKFCVIFVWGLVLWTDLGKNL